MINTNEWITISEAMGLLKVKSRTTLYKYLHRFNIRATKPLGRVYFNLEDIRAAMSANAVKMGV